MKILILFSSFFLSVVYSSDNKPLLKYEFDEKKNETYSLVVHAMGKANRKELGGASDLYSHFKCKKLKKDGYRILKLSFSDDLQKVTSTFKCDETDKKNVKDSDVLMGHICKNYEYFKDIDLLCRGYIVE